MQTHTEEIADGIHRLTTFIPEIAAPAGFTMNQFLVEGEEPLLFHTGLRGMFPLVAEAVERILPVDTLRWISFGHVEADECGAMNTWLAAAPHATVTFGQLGCDISLNDMADRPPRPLDDGEVLDIGGKRLRWIHTPHVPHGWEAGVLLEETTGTMLCGDLFTHVGDGPALTTDDIVEPAVAAEGIFRASAMAPHTPQVMRELAALEPTTLALMHGSSFTGDGGGQLRGLADAYEGMLAAPAPAPS